MKILIKRIGSKPVLWIEFKTKYFHGYNIQFAKDITEARKIANEINKDNEYEIHDESEEKYSKLRETLNDDDEKYKAFVNEYNRKVIVIKKDTSNKIDNRTDERYEFNYIKEYEDWRNTQDWIKANKVHRVSCWRKARRGQYDDIKKTSNENGAR